MSASRTLLFALLPLFASCQVFTEKPADPTANHTRMQGELSLDAGQLVFRPCQEQRRFLINSDGATGIFQDGTQLLRDNAGPLFADVRGHLEANDQTGMDGQLTLSQVYRLQAEGRGCDDPNFRRSTLSASGHEPDWSVIVNTKGLVLNRMDQQPQAWPYLEEQLPDGRFNLTSEANGQRLELWVAPQRCIDSMSGAVSHLTAELRVDGQIMRGCAYFGGARNN